MLNFWDKRYAEKEYAYGKLPNFFFQSHLELGNGRKILLPAEGEGRNAVFAAQRGWDVYAFDSSEAAKRKAYALALENEVSFHYEWDELEDVSFPLSHFDALGCFFAHFSSNKQLDYYNRLEAMLKTGGLVYLEGFAVDHAIHQASNPTAGGPKEADMRFNTAMMTAFFPNCEILLCEQTETVLSEGLYHQGPATVVRFIGKKI